MKTTEAKKKICPYAMTACFMGAGVVCTECAETLEREEDYD